MAVPALDDFRHYGSAAVRHHDEGVTRPKGATVPAGVESLDSELDAMAREFLRSQYAGPRFNEWPIDRRLHAYLLHRGLTNIADNGTVCAALLERVMVNIAAARHNGMLAPD
jgi:hypothetical protein